MGETNSLRRMTVRDIGRWGVVGDLHLSIIDDLINRGYGITVTHYSDWCTKAMQITSGMGIAEKCLVCPLAGGSILTLGCTENGLDNRRQKLNFSIEKGVAGLTIESAQKYRRKFVKIYEEWLQNL